MGLCQKFFERQDAQKLECAPRGSWEISVAGPRHGVLRLSNWATLGISGKQHNLTATYPTKGWDPRE